MLSSVVEFVTDTLPFLIKLFPDLIASSMGDTGAASSVLSSLLSSDFASSVVDFGSSLSSK